MSTSIGRPGAPADGARRLARRSTREEGAHFDQRDRRSTARRSARWSPGAPTRAWSSVSLRRVPRAGRRAGRASARVHGPRGRHARSRRSRSTACSSAPAPTRGSATCAPPPRWSPAVRSPTAFTRWSSRVRCRSRSRPRPRGSTRSSAMPASTGARAGCSMCLGMNPDIAAPGERVRVDLEPQLRGPPGTRCSHPPGLAPDGGRGRDRGPLR